ncbi:hypothetical protein [Streptomyces sp. Amel2xC10]|uniref:hypothetical protein n=1 Tax=Streptomyces sp. Amel2xC10 TaxID=1305826 RepID=UPI000A08E79F|nr:hypothetical protein [Streptomyces sp. Amel2xC10]SME88289.1 hypothetical protein SAMN02745830_00082 [Streptomyces sp. Amel2xC10]
MSTTATFSVPHPVLHRGVLVHWSLDTEGSDLTALKSFPFDAADAGRRNSAATASAPTRPRTRRPWASRLRRRDAAPSGSVREPGRGASD